VVVALFVLAVVLLVALVDETVEVLLFVVNVFEVPEVLVAVIVVDVVVSPRQR
jgi:hypothetical protein